MSIVPPTLKSYSLWLKIEGVVYMGLPVAAYFVKTGLAWHDAGPPFTFSGVKFHPCAPLTLVEPAAPAVTC